MSSDVIWHIRDKLWPMPKHGSIRKVHACLAVTCHLHFWQNDRGLLRATAVTLGWNGYRKKSQHRKLTLEKKILPQLLQGFELACSSGVYLHTFRMVVLWAMWHTFVACCTYTIHVFSVVVLYFTWYFYVPCGICMFPLVVLWSPWYSCVACGIHNYVPFSSFMFPVVVSCSMWYT